MTTYVQSGVGQASPGASFNITLSASPTSGNLLLMGIGVDQYEYTRTANVPSGWEAVTDLTVSESQKLYIYKKVSNGTEGTSIAISISGTGAETSHHSGVIIEYTPCILSQTNTAIDSGSVSIVPASESMRAVSIVLYRNETPSISTSGWTRRQYSTSSYTVTSVGDRDSLTSGTGTITVTWSNVSYSYLTFIGLLLASSATALPRRALDGPFYGSLRGSVR